MSATSQPSTKKKVDPQSNKPPPGQDIIEKSWFDLRRHQDGTIMKPDELEKYMQDPLDPINDDVLDRIHGSMIGMALGDALGAHVEFRPHEYMLANPVTTLKGGGTWGLKKGQFTDDTSMALCLANSLVVQEGYDPYDQLLRYKWWFKDGYMSSTGQCFDIGAATRDSLLEFERRQKLFAKKYKIPPDELHLTSDPALLEKFDVKCSNKGVAGNGALMRLAPVPLFFHRDPIYAVEYSGHSGEITHGDQKAYDACRYYGALIVAAVNGASRNELLDKDFYKNHKKWFDGKSLHPDIERIAQGSYQNSEGYAGGIRGKGYIVNALEAALWAFWSDEESFEKGALAAVNLGDDTDTTAAIYGQLAGAYYGFRRLPQKWTEQVYAKGFIACLSKWITYEGDRWEFTEPAVPGTPSVTAQPSSDATSKLFFGQKTDSSGQSAPGTSSKYSMQSPAGGSDTQSESIPASKQPTDLPKDDTRGRSHTHGDLPETLKPRVNEQSGHNRTASGSYKNLHCHHHQLTVSTSNI